MLGACLFRKTVCFSSACRYASPADRFAISDDDTDRDDDEDEDEFHYPGSSSLEYARPASRASNSTDYFSRAGVFRAPADLTPQLSQAPDFRVPTHEAPQKTLTSRFTAHHAHAQWERDETVHQCRDCQRRFNFLNRRVCTFPSSEHLMSLNRCAACRALIIKLRWLY